MGNKILIVDDEPDLVKVAAFRLKKSGYEVMVAVNGRDALESVKKEKPNLILLDLRIPLISGQEVCKTLKSDDRFKNIPVIIFTASAERVSEKVVEMGADDYLIKPFNPEELLKKVKKFIT